MSYVFSNEGYSHGHALSYTTTLAHKFNSSVFYERFLNLAKHLKFEKISIKHKIDKASEIILIDRKHLYNNPKSLKKEDIIELLDKINHLNLS